VMGILVHDMPIGRAFETYAILTVGDGLVTQIPAVIISIASALLLARGGATGPTDFAIVSQLGRHPSALAAVAVLMGVFAIVPGLPFLPFVLAGAGLGAWAIFEAQRASRSTAGPADGPADIAAPAPSIGDVLDLDDIHVEFAPDMVPMVLDPATGLDARIDNMRRHVASSFGVILSEIRLTDDASLPAGTYVIRIHGVEQARDRLRPDRVLALAAPGAIAGIPGEDVKEPVYGAASRWIDRGASEEAALSGTTVVTPVEVLATHLLEVIKRNFPRLMGMRALRRLLDEMTSLSDPRRAEANRRLIDELVPDRVPVDLLLAVLRLLLEERISIRNLPLILEAIAEVRSPGMTAEAVSEHVRRRLSFQIVAGLRRPDGTVPLVQLSPDWEETFATYEIDGPAGQADVALPPEEFNRLATAVAEKLMSAGETGAYPAVVTTMRRRRFLRTILNAKGITNPVLSFEELAGETRPAFLGLVAA